MNSKLVRPGHCELMDRRTNYDHGLGREEFKALLKIFSFIFLILSPRLCLTDICYRQTPIKTHWVWRRNNNSTTMHRKASTQWHPHTLQLMHARTTGCMHTFELARARKHPPVSLALVTLSFSLSFFVCPATTSRSAERACEIIIWPSDQDGFSRDNRKSSSSNDRCSWQYLATDKGRRRRPLQPGPGCTSLSYSLSGVKVVMTPVGALQCTGTLANNLCNLSLGVSLQCYMDVIAVNTTTFCHLIPAN